MHNDAHFPGFVFEATWRSHPLLEAHTNQAISVAGLPDATGIPRAVLTSHEFAHHVLGHFQFRWETDIEIEIRHTVELRFLHIDKAQMQVASIATLLGRPL